MSLVGASNSEVTIEAVPEPTTPLEVRSPKRNVIWGFSTTLATIRRRLDEQIRELPYSQRVEGYYVVAVGLLMVGRASEFVAAANNVASPSPLAQFAHAEL